MLRSARGLAPGVHVQDPPSWTADCVVGDPVSIALDDHVRASPSWTADCVVGDPTRITPDDHYELRRPGRRTAC